MKTTKRLLAVLLALALLCVGVPLAAQAEDGLAATGSCGENVTWRFDAETGELTINGNGRMDDYHGGDSPFCSNCEIKTVAIGGDVTSIGANAFSDCGSLTAVFLANRVETVCENAFLACSRLANVCYCGTVNEWKAVKVEEGNEPLQNAEIQHHDPQIAPYVPATCTEEGYAPFICTRCGEITSKTDPDPALGHDYQPAYEWASDNSTVTASLTCTRCSDVQTKETVGTVRKMVEATCTNPGLLTYTSKGFANKAFNVQTKTIEIAQKPHMTMRIREVSPTCDKEGVGSYWTCCSCNGIFEDEAATKPLQNPPVLPKLPHTPGEPVTENETAATCTAGGGYDTVVCCFVCGAELSRERTETPAIDHADVDNDGNCDFCGDQMQGGDHCKYCGRIHNGNFFDKLTGFFHKIFAVFKR